MFLDFSRGRMGDEREGFGREYKGFL